MTTILAHEPTDMKKDEIQEHLSFWRERQASKLTPATIFQFKMCCTGHGLGDLQPSRYPDESKEPKITTKNPRNKGQSHRAPGTSTPTVDAAA